MRHCYKTDKDELTTVNYFVEVKREEQVVRWGFHPRLPEGMHWKKGDEMGLGSDHDDGSQSFADFLEAPSKPIPPELNKKLIAEMGEG